MHLKLEFPLRTSVVTSQGICMENMARAIMPHPVLESQPEASFAAFSLSGFDFDTVQVFDHVDSKELIGLDFDPYANHAVTNITS